MSNQKNENDKLIHDHEYDGIKELDNPLPGWWLMTFYITIAFSVVYVLYYHVLGGPNLDESLEMRMAKIEELRDSDADLAAVPDEQQLLAILDNPDRMEKGRAEYISKCAVCHGDRGQGGIGSNLADGEWIHSDGSISSIAESIRKGIPERGMPPWEGQIPHEQIMNLSAYVYSMEKIYSQDGD